MLTKVGRMASGQRAAASHTGSLAVADTVFDAVIRQYGVLRARNEEQMLDMLQALSQPRRSSGMGLGIVTQSGGAGVMMADRAEEMGLSVPVLSATTSATIARVMPAFGAADNPVDVTGQFVTKPELLSESVVALLDDPSIHIGIVWLQLMTAHVDKLVSIFCEIRDRTHKPFFVCWVAAPRVAVQRLREEGIVVFRAGEQAVEAAAALARYDAFHRAHVQRQTLRRGSEPVLPGVVADGVQPSVQATQWLRDAGVPVAMVSLARDEDEAVSQWRATEGAVALKIESPDITHKTEVGGVMLKLNDETSVRAAFRELMQRARTALPQARLDGVLVQGMAGGHVELVVGAQRDPVFGVVIMVGLGGVLVEVLKDVAFRHAPFDVDEGLAMLEELRMSAVLDGVRGQPGVDRVEVARMLAGLSQWAAAMEPRLAELDLNPVMVGANGPLAVDCVMVFKTLDYVG